MKVSTFLTRNTLTFFICSVLSMLVFPQILTAQNLYSTQSGEGSIVKVTGTSDLQTWTMTSRETISQGLFTFDDKNRLSAVTHLSFSLKTQSLKGGLRAMDKKAQKALKASKFPDISFQLDSAVLLLNQVNQQLIKATGSLTLKGISHTVSLNLLAVTNPDQSLTITGFKDLKFSDYLIKAPGFMGGAMQAGDDIRVQFTLTYNPQSLIVTEGN